MRRFTKTAIAGAAFASLLAAILFLIKPSHQTQSESTPPANSAPSSSLRDWVNSLPASESETDATLLEQGILIAEERAARMERLLATDPQRALNEAFTFSEYHRLPPEIQAIVEKPITQTLDLDVIAVCDTDPETPETFQIAKTPDGARLRISLTDTSRVTTSKKSVPVQGIRLNDKAAFYSTVFHALPETDFAWAQENLPTANADPSRDFLTGESIGSSPILAVSGGHLFRFSSTENLNTLESQIRELDNLPNQDLGSSAFIASLARKETQSFNLQSFADSQLRLFSETVDETREYLIIRVDFSDLPGTPNTQDELETLVTNFVTPALAEFSYNKTTVNVTATAASFRMPHPSSNYYTLEGETKQIQGSNTQDLYDDAIAAYMAAGNPNPEIQYDHVSVNFPKLTDTWAGLATVGGTAQWLQGKVSADTILHELGHNYGLSHASYWQHDANDEASIDPINATGQSEEYGDIFDNMGDGDYLNGHFHAAAKAYLGWITPQEWESVSNESENGTYRVYAFDNVSATGLRAIRVNKSDTNEAYWVAYREKFPGVSRLAEGVYLTWQKGSAYNNRTWLIDTSPSSPNGKTDAGLAVGQTYSDAGAGVHITPVAAGQDAKGKYLDVVVNLGSFPGNQSPSGTLSATTSAIARTDASFSFSGNDPDGDSLSFYWEFGDGTVDLSSASVDHSFPVGGTYDLLLTVSDMKGGTFTQQATIVVSDPINEINERISGTTRNLGAIAANDSVVVVGGNQGSILRSEDGALWDRRNLSLNAIISSVIWTGSEFLAAGQDFSNSLGGWVGTIYRSTDGLTWENIQKTTASVGGSGYISIAATADLSTIVALGSDAKVYVRDSEEQWSTVDLGLNDGAWSTSASVVLVDDTYLIGGYDFTQSGFENRLVLYSSTDATTWENVSADAGFENWKGLKTLAYLNGTLMGSGFNSQIRYSEDKGSTWQTNQQGDTYEAEAFAFGNGVYSAYGTIYGNPNTPQNFLSIDGKNWKPAGSPPNGATYNARAFFKNTFISVGDGGIIHQSNPFESVTVSGYLAWIVGFVSSELDQGSLANPDGDWAPNFLEYALGSDPIDPASVPQAPVLSYSENGNAVITIHRFAKTDVVFELEYSENLVAWTPLGSTTTIDTESLLELTTIQAFEEADSYFIRIKASQ